MAQLSSHATLQVSRTRNTVVRETPGPSCDILEDRSNVGGLRVAARSSIAGAERLAASLPAPRCSTASIREGWFLKRPSDSTYCNCNKGPQLIKAGLSAWSAAIVAALQNNCRIQVRVRICRCGRTSAIPRTIGLFEIRIFMELGRYGILIYMARRAGTPKSGGLRNTCEASNHRNRVEEKSGTQLGKAFTHCIGAASHCQSWKTVSLPTGGIE